MHKPLVFCVYPLEINGFMQSLQSFETFLVLLSGPGSLFDHVPPFCKASEKFFVNKCPWRACAAKKYAL